ncbi:hypothetical protein DYH09_02625 [bacterium CPR1]|nr:hypothetical protein [bacterium CPR1]
MTVMEVLVASAVMLMVVSMVFVVYVNGARAWHRGAGQADLLQDLQVVQGQMHREIASSVYESFSADAPHRAFSLLSARLDGGGFQVLDGEVEWQRYVIFYLDLPSRELRRAELKLPPGAPQRTAPGPIESYDPGTGPRPLADYCTGGRVIGRDLTELTVKSLAAGRILNIEVRGERQRSDGQGMERIVLPTSTQFKN